MKIKILLALFLIFSSLGYSQHTEKLKKLMAILKPVENYIEIDTFKNGNLKEEGNVLVYNYNGNEHFCYSGRLARYYKSGQKGLEYICDSLGFLLSYKTYDPNGFLVFEGKTTKIDTRANSVEELFDFGQNHLVYVYEKYYRYSMKLDTIYLRKEGGRLNGKKIGVWKKYNYKGELKKEKEYK